MSLLPHTLYSFSKFAPLIYVNLENQYWFEEASRVQYCTKSHYTV